MSEPSDTAWRDGGARAPWSHAVVAFAIAVVACGPPPTTRRATGRDAVAAIDAWDAQLSPADRRAKHCKMAASPLAFFRGTNHLFWADLAADPRRAEFSSERTITWIQGDLHPFNFGAYDNDRGVVVYSLNDFDETLIADYQYDVWRMAVAIVLIARSHGARRRTERAVVDAFAEAYLDALADYRGNDEERRTRFASHDVAPPLARFLDEVRDKRSRLRALARWTVERDGQRVFATNRETLEPVDGALERELRGAVAAYGRTLSGRLEFDEGYFRVKSVARRRFAGIGSLGAPRFYLLVEGPTDALDDDRILDIKQQTAPTAYRFVDRETRARYDRAFDDHASRHARGQKALLVNTDDHLGWLRLSDGDYSVRERSVYKETYPAARLRDRARFAAIAAQWGVILATAHARADRDFDATLVPYSFDREVDELTDHRHAEFRALVRDVARDYADRVSNDYAAFVRRRAAGCR